MGYDAYVRCNCYELRKTKPFKFSQFLKTYPEYIDLELPKKLPKHISESKEQIREQYYEWLHKACEHEYMNYCSERRANISGMAWLKSCIDWLGGEKEFPALGTQLPEYNDGYMPIEYNTQFRIDLDKFIKKELTTYYLETRDCHWYIDGSTRNEYDSLLCNNNGIELHSYRGKFIIKKDSNVIFNAENFSVEKRNEEKYIYKTDEKSIEMPIFHMPHIFDETKVLNFYYEINKWNIKEEFEFKYEAFMKLLEASDKTGNPICWS